MGNTARGAFPTHPSNRSFYEQMILWGWEPGKRKSGLIDMHFMGHTIAVQAANVHKGNSAHTFRAVYDITTGGDAAKFWSKEPKAAPAPEPVAAAPAPAPVPEPEQVPEPEPTPEPTVRQRGLANAALGVLLEANGAALTTSQIAERAGMTRDQANSATHYLWSNQVIDRVKTGVYQARPDSLRVDNRVDVDVEHRAHGITIATQPAPAPVTVLKTVPPPPVVPQADDGLLNDVLDLLFPDGFKARHLPLIEAWKDVTQRLIADVSAG